MHSIYQCSYVIDKLIRWTSDLNFEKSQILKNMTSSHVKFVCQKNKKKICSKYTGKWEWHGKLFLKPFIWSPLIIITWICSSLRPWIFAVSNTGHVLLNSKQLPHKQTQRKWTHIFGKYNGKSFYLINNLYWFNSVFWINLIGF